MKIRTDFVTNSSSSSFIFKECNQETTKKDFVGTRFSEHPLCDLMEVYSWYRDEVISQWSGVKQAENWEDRGRWESEMKTVLSKKKYDSSSDEKWAAVFILDVYKEYLDRYILFESEEKNMEVSFDFLNMQIWEYMESRNIADNILKEFYMNNIEQLLSAAKQFDGKQVAEVMEHFFGAQYLYFDRGETHYLVCEALKEAGVCLYFCGHMG